MKEKHTKSETPGPGATGPGPIVTKPIPAIFLKRPKNFWEKAVKRGDPLWTWAKRRSGCGDEVGGECWLWSGELENKSHRYGRYHMMRLNYKAHRVAYELEHGHGSTNGWCVLHRCDVPACVNPAHLFLGDHKDNSKDAQEKGRLRPATTRKRPQRRSSRGRVEPVEVGIMRQKRADGVSVRQIAREHRLSRGYVGKILNGKVQIHDTDRRGRPKGYKGPTGIRTVAKLRLEDVVEIRRRWDATEKIYGAKEEFLRKTKQEFGVARSTINHILGRETWQRAEEELAKRNKA